MGFERPTLEEGAKPEKNPLVSFDTLDMIPPGTFYAPDELSGEQWKAIRLVEKIGEELVAQHPEIADEYRDMSDPQRYIDIALKYIPSDARNFPEVAQKAVGYAIRKLIPPEEQSKLTEAHRRFMVGQTFDFSSVEFLEQCRRAAQRRHELHGVDAEAMVRGRGRIPWEIAEKAMIRDLAANPEFQHTEGSIKGTPNYQKIALKLNEIFHEGKEIRHTNSVASMVRDFRRKKNQ